MKFLLTLSSSVLICTVILSLVPCMGEAQIYNDVIRLHVIGESDSAEDQELKLAVRDAVLECVCAKVANCGSFDEAYAVISNMQAEIKEAAESCTKEKGVARDVAVCLGLEKYPRRDYGEAVLPAGEYTSLRIKIGKAEGKNWWCVLFPSVCTGFAKDENEYTAVGFTPSEYRIITEKSKGWRVRFRILEVLSEIVGFEY